jgi:DNA mismatch repair protein MutL
MTDVIRSLPETVANQIAAGEVVQRPASVVKELVENAVDAKASTIAVHIQEGGRGLIRVIDNGCGLSPGDARKAFERHATSKIARADDLYALTTFGFRGEALPSIASVSEVELRTRRPVDELGLRLSIHGGTFGEPEATALPVGTQIAVKNLFYNVPARRKFLKSKSVEIRHIAVEFMRVALAHPEIEMAFYDDGTERWRLPATGRRQRIVGLFGKHLGGGLLEVKVNTTLIGIEGLVGTPASAKKSGAAEQFLFVNGRFFKSPYLHKAVMAAYEKLIAPQVYPPYFLYLTVDPARIDVNIHPTKTEIKFEDEQAIWQIVHAAVRESLGKLGAVPLMDFEIEDPIDIPVFRTDGREPRPPVESLNPAFNPFDEADSADRRGGGDKPVPVSSGRSYLRTMSYSADGVPAQWEELYRESYDTFDPTTSPGDSFRQFILPEESDPETEEFISQGFAELPDDARQGTLEIDSRLDGPTPYLVLSRRQVAVVRQGQLVVIDLPRASRRVLFERFLNREPVAPQAGQQELFAEPVAVSSEDLRLLEETREELLRMGFDLRAAEHDASEPAVVLHAVPADLAAIPAPRMVDRLLAELHDDAGSPVENRHRRVAEALARTCGIDSARTLQSEEIEEIILSLSGCSEPAFTAEGHPVWAVFSAEEIKKRLK